MNNYDYYKDMYRVQNYIGYSHCKLLCVIFFSINLKKNDPIKIQCYGKRIITIYIMMSEKKYLKIMKMTMNDDGFIIIMNK